MIKVLSEHVSDKSHADYQENIAKIARVTFEYQSSKTPEIKMLSAKELAVSAEASPSN